MKKPEILAPAGSFASLKAAVSAGADAVYMGGPRFGARAYAENPDEAGLAEAIDYVHFHGCRLYLTVNTLLKEKELQSQLYDYLEPLYRQGLDAVIVQDYGVMAFIREHFPHMPVHASTQMTVYGPYGIRMLQDLGIARVVLPRELSFEEVKAAVDTGIEIEVFVHGALCYCYSGQCLMSSLIGGRSGNRGRCAQSCRLGFPKEHLLNMKDLCTLDILPGIIQTGACSLKIEGRMKSPEYTAGVVSIYRKYVDRYFDDPGARWTVDPEDRRLLLELFDRGGFTDGYFGQHNGADMIYKGEKPEMRVPDRSLVDAVRDNYVAKEKTESCSGIAVLKKGRPAQLSLACGDTSVVVFGDEVSAALNRPLTREDVVKQFSRLGDTGYALEELEVRMDEGIFMPVGAMNRLRREAVELLTKERLDAYKRFD